ncbi:cation diffusion facilitator family transporter [Pasteurella canis]|uniref:cation diffusion facilitator family transporter n=1 Tax=Pasteurella canis TaxID=753 RepID=UPI001CC385DB|nr:cation diffusion facilitator family transporter [Pasteurella canis]UAY77618.1 cation diffusion facilitator family transporter [Pasteurella canis]
MPSLRKHHEHTSNHTHIHTASRRILLLSFILITSFMIVEFLSGYYFNSLALMADAGHMANDSFALLIALIALYLNSQNQRRAAMLNGFSLVLVAIYIIWEAIERWQYPQQIASLPMLIVAVLGLLVNGVVVHLMLKGDHINLNLRAAYLHVLADVLGSIVAIIAGLSAYLFDWVWVDIIASFILSLFVLKSGYAIIKAAILGEN